MRKIESEEATPTPEGASSIFPFHPIRSFPSKFGNPTLLSSCLISLDSSPRSPLCEPLHSILSSGRRVSQGGWLVGIWILVLASTHFLSLTRFATIAFTLERLPIPLFNVILACFPITPSFKPGNHASDLAAAMIVSRSGHPAVFRIMGERSFSDLHKMCDDYMDPCLYEKFEMMTSVYVKCLDGVTEYAKVAINFYNKKEQKNFSFVQVERLYSFCCGNGYCMTFWARNGRSDEFRLFRAVLLEVDHEDDDDKITIPAEQDDAWVEKLNETDEVCLP